MLIFFLPSFGLGEKVTIHFCDLFFVSHCGSTKNYCVKLSLSFMNRAEKPCYLSKRKEFKRNWRYSPIYNVMLSCLS